MEMGNLAEWVAAVLTGGALIVAAYQLRRGRVDAKLAQNSEYEAMARAVGVTASWQPAEDGGPPSGFGGLMPVEVEILNAGKYPISGAVLVVPADEYPKEVVYGTILPGQHIKESYLVRRAEVVFGELTGGVELLFTDSYDHHWARTPHSLEHRVDQARIC